MRISDWSSDVCSSDLAYNRKAQEEMASRTAGLGARIQTLNALGYDLIGRHVGRRPNLLDESEVHRRLEPHLPKLAHRLNNDPMAPYLEGLSVIRHGLQHGRASCRERAWQYVDN